MRAIQIFLKHLFPALDAIQREIVHEMERDGAGKKQSVFQAERNSASREHAHTQSADN